MSRLVCLPGENVESRRRCVVGQFMQKHTHTHGQRSWVVSCRSRGWLNSEGEIIKYLNELPPDGRRLLAEGRKEIVEEPIFIRLEVWKIAGTVCWDIIIKIRYI